MMSRELLSFVATLLLLCNSLQLSMGQSDSGTSTATDGCIPTCQCTTSRRSSGNNEQYLEVNCSGRGFKTIPSLVPLLPSLPTSIDL